MNIEHDITQNILRWIYPILSLCLVPLIVGLTDKVKAYLSCGGYISLFYFYRELYTLWKKNNDQTLYAPLMQKMGPTVLLVPLLFILLIIPAGTELPAIISFEGDFLLLVSLLTFFRFIQISITMNWGLSLPMLGASRWTTISVLTDPILLLSIITGMILTRAHSFSDICVPSTFISEYAVAPLLLIFVAMMALILCEIGRIPFDFNAPGFETTQVHRLLSLYYSGKELATIQYAHALKYWVLIQIMGTITAIHCTHYFYDCLLQLLIPFIIAIFVGVIDATRPKTRLPHHPRILLAGIILSIVALIFSIIASVSERGVIQ